MPYKDPKKAKEQKRKYYEKRKEELKAYAIKWYKENKETVLKQHQDKSEELKADCKKWRSENKDKVKEYKLKTTEERKVQAKKDRKKATNKLVDWYVINNIKARTGLSIESIKKYPELIQNHKQQIQLKRLLKRIKNGK